MCFAVRGRHHRMHPSGVAAHYQVVLLHALSTEEDQWGFLVCFFGLLLFCSVILLSCVDKGMLTDYIRCSHADRSYVTCAHTRVSMSMWASVSAEPATALSQRQS